jgi:hypothetical protein
MINVIVGRVVNSVIVGRVVNSVIVDRVVNSVIVGRVVNSVIVGRVVVVCNVAINDTIFFNARDIIHAYLFEYITEQ